MKFEYITNSGVMSENIWGRNLCEGAKRPGPRERSDGAGVGCGRGCPSSHGRELCIFFDLKMCNLGHTYEGNFYLTTCTICMELKKKHGLTLFGGQGPPSPPPPVRQ